MHYLLSLLIWFPIISGIYVLALCSDRNTNSARLIALFTLILSLGICVPLFNLFDMTSAQMQFVEKYTWLPSLGIAYHLGIDGVSLLMIALTTFTSLIIIFATWYNVRTNVAQYIGALLILQGILVGVFAALDAILFYIFWEASLIPMYLIIGVWGSSNRIYAAIKFFLFTFVGSVLMLLAFLYMGTKAGTFEIAAFYSLPLGMSAQVLIFWGLFFGFAIKIPMFPIHTWLPDAHTEAPAGGSIILAAILLKLGAYGFLRFSMPIVPDASAALAGVMIVLSLIAIVYIGLVTLVQKDIKRLVAYSSIAHMGFVTLGFFVLYYIVRHHPLKDAALAFQGGVFTMISHAFISGAMFAGIGFIYDRMHTRQINDFGGVVNSMPIFAAFFLLFAMANAGLPGTSGFVGEFMVIIGSFKAGFWIAFLAAMSLILGAAYTLWMYKRVIFGAATNPKTAELEDIRGFELLTFVLLAAMVLFFGVYPAPILDVLHPSVEHIMALSTSTKL